MGLQISDIIPRKQIMLKDLKGKIICVDAYNAIYQFLTTIRQPDGTPLQDSKGRITSHLSGLLYRNTNLLAEGIKLVYVFDGKPPELKGGTNIKRAERKEEAKEKYERAREEEDVEEMRKYSGRMIHITKEIVEESKELLEAMGIAIVQAPSEGESQASHLARIGEAWGVGSQDYDSLLFGTPRLIQNLTLAQKRKTISGYVPVFPEMIELEKVLNHLGINMEQLICLGILSGTDYNPGGIKGIGQKKALQIVKQHQQPVLIFRSVEKQMIDMEIEGKGFNWKEIFEMFKK
ncbi:flap endonuclease-1, partial [Candidatus Pacearchaeota archaeon CG10_big_fil_rev_8_21_14_0_10_35_13]